MVRTVGAAPACGWRWVVRNPDGSPRTVWATRSEATRHAPAGCDVVREDRFAVGKETSDAEG